MVVGHDVPGGVDDDARTLAARSVDALHLDRDDRLRRRGRDGGPVGIGRVGLHHVSGVALRGGRRRGHRLVAEEVGDSDSCAAADSSGQNGDGEQSGDAGSPSGGAGRCGGLGRRRPLLRGWPGARGVVRGGLRPARQGGTGRGGRPPRLGLAGGASGLGKGRGLRRRLVEGLRLAAPRVGVLLVRHVDLPLGHPLGNPSMLCGSCEGAGQSLSVGGASGAHLSPTQFRFRQRNV